SGRVPRSRLRAAPLAASSGENLRALIALSLPSSSARMHIGRRAEPANPIAAPAGPSRSAIRKRSEKPQSKPMTDYRTCPSLPAMFFAQAARCGDKPFLWAKRDGAYAPITWSEAARQASALSRALRALGVARGDRVALVSENRPEWAI